MRIIGGEFKGRRFYPPKHISARPTTDFAKEALFNILENRLDFSQTESLDLFAGIGSISLELISRACPHVSSVERDHKNIAFLKKTLDFLTIENMNIVQEDVFKFLKYNNREYDFVFADPPYDMSKIENLPDILLESKIFKKQALLIIEHSKKIDYSSHAFFQEHRKYGNVNFSFFKIE